MPALDTNVLVRYIVQDDAGQLTVAKRLISRILGEGLTLFVPVTVVLELEWVLRSSFGAHSRRTWLPAVLSRSRRSGSPDRFLCASAALSKMCGATPRFSSASPSLLRRKALVV